MIKEVLPNSDAKIRVLEIIYKNPDINFTKIVKLVKTSPNIVLNYLNILVKNKILNEKKVGGARKTHIRLFRPNFLGLGIDLFSYVELENRNRLVQKYKELEPYIGQLSELLTNTSVKFCLIYGSFARFTADNNSDLDLWLVGKTSMDEKNRLKEIFSTFNREFNIALEDEKTFLNKINDPIHQNILKEHVIIYNEREFLKILGKL